MDAISIGDELRGVPASFMRGGTSKGLFFRWEDLPEDRDGFLCSVLGSPDPNGRQLDGMGGGISSLSKAMMVRRSARENVEVDYLFAQVAVDKPLVDYASNCGNLSAAVGAFAVDRGLARLPDGPGVVRMFNENTGKRIDCHLTVRGGRSAVRGTEAIAGVTGQGAAIRLDFLDPGGARTGRLLPTGAVIDQIDGFTASFVDAGNPCIFLPADAFGLTGGERPVQFGALGDVMARLETVRRALGVATGFTGRPDQVPESVPKIALVGPPGRSDTLSGETLETGDCDVQVRMVSMGVPHMAIPLTGAMAVAVAARIPGTVVAELARAVPDGAPLRIGTASGVVPAMAQVSDGVATRASVYRTARLLMDGIVYAPG